MNIIESIYLARQRMILHSNESEHIDLPIDPYSRRQQTEPGTKQGHTTIDLLLFLLKFKISYCS